MDEMNRIAIVAHGISGGGAERVACILANYLAGKAHYVLFIAAYDDMREYALDDRVDVLPIYTRASHPAGRLADRCKQIFLALRHNRIDVVISFITNEVLLAEIFGIPIIHTLRNDPNRNDSGFPKAQLRNFAYKYAKHIVFQTEGARRYFSRAIQEKGSVIPNPLAVEKLPMWKDSEHNSAFITACRLEEQKNLPMLINAFAAFHKSHSDFSLEIYGEGTLFNDLMRRIHALDASAYIHLMGRSNHIFDVMQRSYAFVLSSDYEGLSNSMLEALAIGIPCICTDCPPGGAREHIHHMESGVLVPTGDENAMCDALKVLADNKALCEKLSSNAIQVRDILNKDIICAEWERLID